MKILIITLILFFTSPAYAEDIYIAESAVGGDTGADCANAHSAAWFNTAGNWGGGAGEINPGDTAHLCGSISTSLNAQLSGTSGNVITIYFEDDAKISQAATTQGSALLSVFGLAYILVDGGTNGILENTDRGSPQAGYGDQSVSYFLAAHGGANNIEIKNLTFQNQYVHTSMADDNPALLATYPTILLSDLGVNVSIHDNTFSNVGWVINFLNMPDGAKNLRIYNNTINDYCHGISGGSSSYNGTSDIWIYDNNFTGGGNWNSTNGNVCHMDGLHFFDASGVGQAGDYPITDVHVYNNLFDGSDWGGAGTALIYIETLGGSEWNIYNNVFLAEVGERISNGFVGGLTLTNYYNNTLIGGDEGNGYLFASANGISTMANFKNNLLTSEYRPMYLVVPPSGGIDYNLYANYTYLQYNPGSNDVAFADFANWKTAMSDEANSYAVADAYVGSTGYLNSNSGAIGKGVNLTALCSGGLTALCQDKDGVNRPTSGAWDIGAYQYTGYTSQIMNGGVWITPGVWMK